MSDSHAIRPLGSRSSEWKCRFKRIIAASVATGALDATPTAVADSSKPTTGVIDLQDAPACRLMFGGTDAANEAINYQVILWYMFDVGDGRVEWIPRLVATGVATLGAMAMPATLVATSGLFADQITDTLADTDNFVESAANDCAAILYIKARGAKLLQVETDIDTAASAEVFAQLGE